MSLTQITARDLEARHLVQVYGQLPIEPERAQGVYLHCGERRIIDFYGGHAVAALGYGHPAMLAALEEQASSLLFQSNAVPLRVRARAAETLARFSPSGLDHVFFVNSGAEANENALRIACRLTGRSRVAAIEHGFHGRTAAAGAVTWGASTGWYGFPRSPFDVDFVGRNDLAGIDAAITNDTAAVIMELVQGVAGAFDLNPAFARAVAAACSAKGAMLIIDEVQSGIGRCGQPFATDVYGLRPDIITAAKSLAGGFPCGAVIVTAAVSAELGPGDLGSTFGGGPLACAMLNAVIEVIEKEDLMHNVRARHAQLADACPVGPVERMQGLGFLIGLRCRRPATQVRNALLDRNILVGTSADPQVIRLLPPLVLDGAQMTTLIESLAQLPED